MSHCEITLSSAVDLKRGAACLMNPAFPPPYYRVSRMRTRHFGTGFVPLHVFWSARADCHAHIACIRLGLPFCIFRFRSPQYQLLSRLSAIFIFLKKSSHVNVKKNKNKANNKLIKGILLHGSRRVDSTVRAGGKIQGILTYCRIFYRVLDITVIFNNDIFNIIYLISIKKILITYFLSKTRSR